LPRRSEFKDFILFGALSPQFAERGPNLTPTLIGASFAVALAPIPLLARQQEVIAQDFAMKNGRAEIPVRMAQLYYFQSVCASTFRGS